MRMNKHLKDKLIFLAFGGKHVCRASIPTSDIDIRSCTFNSKANLIGIEDSVISVNEVPTDGEH